MTINNNILKYIFVIIIFSLLIIDLLYPIQRVKAYKKISPSEVKSMMDSNAPIILLDVRSSEEFKEGHIKNALNAPLDELKDKVSKENISKDSTVIVYCQSGRRADIAAKNLEALGYKNISNLGGIQNWPYEITK